MHGALAIPEVLCHIFDHYSAPVTGGGYDKEDAACLAALARTCRAFKEPALDGLWRVLHDLSPLVQCLPSSSGNKRSLNRQLMESEWDILRSYTRRIWSIKYFNNGPDWLFVTFLNPPTTEPLFPSLRFLRCDYTKEAAYLLDLPLPSLVSLDVKFSHLYSSQDSLSFPKFSPNLRNLFITLPWIDFGDQFSIVEFNYISRWQNLQSVICHNTALDMDTLLHLSRIPTLTQLGFGLNTTSPTSDSLPVFSHLRELAVNSNSLDTISRFLSQIRLPAITCFLASINDCPLRHELSSFFTAVQISGAGHTIESFTLHQLTDDVGQEDVLLGFEDLQPCMALKNLRSLNFCIQWDVGLRDSQVLALVLAWPNIEHFLINVHYDWGSRGGVTPGGLLQLLQTCPSLREISLYLDTRGYTVVPPSQVLESLRLKLSPELSIYVLDSCLEEYSVPAITAFFSYIAVRVESHFSLHTFNSPTISSGHGYDMRLWDRVRGALSFESKAGGAG